MIMGSFDRLRESFAQTNISFGKTIEAFNVLGSCCVHYIRDTHSNNWLKMHGLPMRRKRTRMK